MNKRRTIGLAAATVVLSGLGAFGAATTAFAAAPTPNPTPSATSSFTSASDGGDAGVRKGMVRHCTDQLPAGERAEAQRAMEKMMSRHMMAGDDGAPGNSMMGGASADGHGAS